MLRQIIALCFMLCITASVLAAPSLLGPTGLLFTPTADALQQNTYNLSAQMIESVDDPLLSFNYGLRDNLEIGFTRMAEEGTIINAKYNFFPETAEQVGLAFGVIDLTDERSVALYGVASKRFNLSNLTVDNFRAHLGISTGREGDEFIPLCRVFGALTFDIAKKCTAMVEYDGNSTNYGLRTQISPGLDATIGLAGNGEQLVVGGLSYSGIF